jgi:uncharacterized membrane protein
VTTPIVFWPVVLGISFLAVGIFNYRPELLTARSRGVFRLAALGPVFVASALAAFAGEHFTAANSLAQLVPKWMPAPVFVAYFVGVAHLAAALSLIAKRGIRWSMMLLAIMFACFVLLMDLPAALRHAANRVFWIFPVREGTFAIGALALLATDVRRRHPGFSHRVATVARLWTALALAYFGAQNLLYPQFSPGVPDTQPVAAWVPFPHLTAYLTGILLAVFGLSMFVRKYAGSAAMSAGLWMVLLTVTLYVPQFFLAHGATEYVTALNFVFDTLLFAGTLLVIGNAIAAAEPRMAGAAQTTA